MEFEIPGFTERQDMDNPEVEKWILVDPNGEELAVFDAKSELGSEGLYSLHTNCYLCRRGLPFPIHWIKVIVDWHSVHLSFSKVCLSGVLQ